ncbi:MAG: ATP-binding protein [Oscillospiraceae bacterium]|nr:ATP-binding protein [Oscillospiraceae bacterium]
MTTFENYFEGDLDLRDGLPATTKEQNGYHGFGLKSIRATAEKYKGQMSVHMERKLFILRVSIPLP